MSLLDALVVCAGIALFLTVPMYVARGLTGLVDRYRPTSRGEAIGEITEPPVTSILQQSEENSEPDCWVTASPRHRASELVDAFVESLIDEMVSSAYSAMRRERTAVAQRTTTTMPKHRSQHDPVGAKTTIP